MKSSNTPFNSIRQLAAFAVLGLLALSATANDDPVIWLLNDNQSSLNYVSVKKEHVAETNHFVAAEGESPALAGSISQSGNTVFSVDLNRIDSGIEIRDGRLQSILYETQLLPKAWLHTSLDTANLATLSTGDFRFQTLNGEFSLHGVRQSVTAEVLIQRPSDNELRVATVEPVNISSADFDMDAGIEALRVIANLSSIGESVPVYFDLTLTTPADNSQTAVAMPEAPADPTSLAASFDEGDAQASLEWLDAAGNETHYLVRRRPDSGAWQTVAELATDSAAYAESLPDTGEFDYKVIALNDGVPSLPSNIERITVTEGDPVVRGEVQYGDLCAGCHGANGEGSDDFPALNTERDVEEMIQTIVDTMPFGNAGACDHQCATDVAAFIQTWWENTGGGGNQAPTANATASPNQGFAPLTVNFDGNASSDPDGDTLTYAWDFGDGNTANTASPDHTFINTGTYNVSLTVSDGNGESATATLTVVATEPVPTGAWALDPTVSSLHFVSTKKLHVIETHQFTQLSGDINTDGLATVRLHLDSVDSGIEIRDERMRNLLFDTANFPLATITLQLDSLAPESLPVGQTTTATIQPTVDLHGIAIPLTIPIRITRMSTNSVLVQNTQPIVVQAGDFNLSAGIDALRDIAGLSVISYAVPTNFTLLFVAQQ